MRRRHAGVKQFLGVWDCRQIHGAFMEENNIEVAEEQSYENAVVSNPVDHNWKQANEVLSAQKRQIEELERKLNQINAPKVIEEPDEFENLDPEDYMTVGKAKLLAKKLAEKQAASTAKQIVDEYIQQQNVAMDEQRMKSKYEDYDFIIENYAIPLIKNDPALAHKIQMSKNPAETAYKLGKLSDNYEPTSQMSSKAEKILKNSSRPVSAHAVNSPLKSQAESFAKMSKADIWAQAQEYAKGA